MTPHDHAACTTPDCRACEGLTAKKSALSIALANEERRIARIANRKKKAKAKEPLSTARGRAVAKKKRQRQKRDRRKNRG